MHRPTNLLAESTARQSSAVAAPDRRHCHRSSATGGSVNMAVRQRLKLLPYETLIGFTIAAVSALMFGVFNLAG